MEALQSYLTAENLTQLGLKLVIALAIFIIGRWIAKAIVSWFKKMFSKRGMDSTLATFLGNVIYAVLLTAVIVAALQSLGVPVTSFLAILGAAGLAIGLALKDSLGNFASGVMIVAFRPFTKGDLVEVADITGKVDQVNIFSTEILTLDNKRVIVPNGQIMANPITNHTAEDVRRVDMVIGVGYDDDLKLARQIMLKACTEHPKVLQDPKPNVFVIELGDSSVNFNVRPWCKTDDYWTVWGDVLETCKVELEAAGLSIPYPQQDVHMHQVG